MLQNHPFIRFLLKIAGVIVISITTFFGTLFFFFFGFVLFVIIVAAASKDSVSDQIEYKNIYGNKESSNKFLSIPISGVIMGEREELSDPFSFLSLGVTYGYEIKRQLYSASRDGEIKGIILEVNSPGGTIYGSMAIADGITYFQKTTKKPVIAHISGIGASGAYLASVSADDLFADYGSTIGSIGVIFGPFKYYDQVISENEGSLVGGVVTENGIETTYFTAGKSKDLGNPYRKITPEEIQVLQQSVNNEYQNFVAYVSKARNIPQETIRSQIGALIYDNKTAQNLGLIDATLNKEQTYRELARRSRLSENQFQVVRLKKELGFAQSLLESISPRKNTAQVSFCPFSTTILAYHGDTISLCQ